MEDQWSGSDTPTLTLHAMEDPWSGSDTPTLMSDDEEPRDVLDVLAVLNCSLTQKTDRFSFLQTGFIHRLLSLNEENPFEDGNGMLYFFERPFVEKSAYMSKERNVLFMCVRSALFGLMRLSCSGLQVTNYEDMGLNKARKEISRVLHFCNNTISRCKFVEPIQEIEDLTNDLGSLLNSIGTLCGVIKMYSIRKICKDRLVHAIFHIHLELDVHYVMLILQLVYKYPNMMIYLTKFTKTTEALVHDLISVSFHMFERININGKSIWDKDCFTCTCLKEVWVVLMHCIDNVSKKFSVQSFWSVVSAELQNSHDNTESSQGDTESKQDRKYPVEFAAWFLCQVAPLYWIDPSGVDTFSEKLIVPRNWQLVQELIQHALSVTTVNDTALKCILWSCICLTRHWDCQLNVFCLIWNYIYKEMNTVRKSDTQSLNTYFKTVYSLDSKFELCVTYTSESPSFDTGDTIFDLFLRYLVVTIKRLKLKDDAQMLSQIKGRVYSKFHKRSMNEINANGLEEFTTLFTVLALVFGVDEIPKKMCALTSLLLFNQQMMDVRKLIIQNVFLSLFICKNLRLPADSIVQKLIGIFTNLITLLYETKKKKELYVQSWDLLCYYLECVEQCFDFNVLIPDEGQLICSIYSNLLKITPDNQKRKLFVHFTTILSSSYVQQRTLSSTDYALVWKNIYLPVSEVTLNENNSSNIAEIIAAISILSLERLSTDENQNFALLANKYAFAADVPVLFKCLYMSRTLSSSVAIQKIIALGKSKDVVKGWITCVLQNLYQTPAVMELTRAMISSPEILKWVPQKECNLVEHVETILIEYVMHLGKLLDDMTTLNELSDFRKDINFYFSDFMRVTENIIFNGNCEKSTSFLFKVAGQLVKSCCKSLYSKTSPLCILPQILDVFVLPLTSSKKPPSSLTTKTLKMHIHLFLSGLATLNSKTDSFLNRKIREVLKKHFMEFVMMKGSSEAMQNPFLISLNASCSQNPTKPSSDYRHLVLEYVRDNFLYLPQPPEQLVCVLSFLLELIQNTLSEEENANTMKLLSMKMASCILVCDAVGGKGEPREVRKCAMNILRKMVSQTPNDSSREILSTLLRKFLTDNIGYYQAILLKTMQSMCMISPEVVTSLLPEIELLISEQEKKRGVGTDGDLRKSHEELKAFVSSMTSNN